VRGVVGIGEHGEPRGLRRHFLQELKAAGDEHIGRVGGEAGHVAAGAREAPHQLLSHGIGDHQEHHGDGARRVGGGVRGQGGGRHDHVHLGPHELGGEGGQAIEPAFGRAPLDHEIAALDEALLSQPLQELLEERPFGDLEGVGEDAEPIHASGGLGVGGHGDEEKQSHRHPAGRGRSGDHARVSLSVQGA
jgi:hypothetical protein